MGTDKNGLMRGIKFLLYTIALMFLAPVVLAQAFKNQTHPWYWPVLIVGLLLAIAAIVMGFYGIKIMVDSLFKGNGRSGRTEK